MLPSEWEKRLVDLNVTTLSARDLAWADIAFVSAMLVQREATRHVISRCRQAGLKVIAPGSDRRRCEEANMRKRMIGQDEERLSIDDQWLNLERMARAEISSEDADYPIESAIRPGSEGWRAAHTGEQVVRFIFDESQRIRRIRLVFQEEGQERTQEFALAWAGEDDPAPREIVRQQYHFHPPQNTREVEDYQVDLHGVKSIELRIRPDISGGEVRASLCLIQIA